MKQTTFKVSKEFLIAGHAEACGPWKRKLEEKFPEAFKKVSNVTFAMGDRITGIGYGKQMNDEYMVTQIALGTVNLIDLKSGNRWSDTPLKVDKVTQITLTEFKKLIKHIPESQEIKVNEKTVSLKEETKSEVTEFEVDAEFIKEAAKAADSDWEAKIKAKFPKVFDNGYLKLTEGTSNRMIQLTEFPEAIQSDVRIQMCIAQGFAEEAKRSDLYNHAIVVKGSDLADVEVVHDTVHGRYLIAFKKKS